MDKEGHPVKFSSEKIPEKKQPDFFVASNEKAERRKRLSIGAFFSKIGKAFKLAGVKLLNYIKHPIRGKHKIVTIILAIAIIVTTILIILNVTIWQKTSKDTTPLSDEESEQWGIELASVINEGSKLPDDEFKTFYTNTIKDQKREAKAIDLNTMYANELAKRGYVDLSLDLLRTLNIDDMTCSQVVRYYSAYALMYYVMSNESETSDSEYYNSLATEQEEFCQTGERPSVEGLEEVDLNNIVPPSSNTEEQSNE